MHLINQRLDKDIQSFIYSIILFNHLAQTRNPIDLMESTHNETYKVIIVGSSGVGKSSLLLRFTDNAYETNLLATIGVDFKFKSVTLNQGQKVKLQIWDTAGSQSFRAIVSAYYRGADAVIMVFSATNRPTWNDLKQFWINQLNKYKSAECKVFIFQNKIDLLDQQNKTEQPSEEEIKEFMDKQDIKLQFRVSAKTGEAVQQAFVKIAQELHKNSPKIKSKLILEQSLNKKKDQSKKQKNCCK